MNGSTVRTRAGGRLTAAVRVVVLAVVAAAALSSSSSATTRAGTASPYVTACGTRFCVDGSPMRVVGANTFSLVHRPGCHPYADPDTVLRVAHDAGMTVVRVALYQELVQDDGYARFDAALAAARRYEIRLLPFLEDQNHGSGDCVDNHPFRPIAWYRTGYRLPEGSHRISYRDYVAATLRRYRNEPAIFAWTLISEPVATGAARCDPAFARFFADMTAVAWQADDHHLVDVGSSAPGLGGWDCTVGPDRQSVILALPHNDFVEYHDYANPPCAGSVQCLPDPVAAMLAVSRALDRPLLVAEMGVTPAQTGGSRDRRAVALAVKATRECQAGVAGVLVWQLQMNRGTNVDDYAILPADPALGELSRVPCGADLP